MVDNILQVSFKVRRKDFECFCHKEMMCEETDMYPDLNITQCIHVLKHHIASYKYA
jgi:hypothetical protein